MAGRQDFVRSPAATEGLAKLIPGAQFVTIAPGHFMPTTSPEVLVRVLRDFWNI